MTVDMRNVLIVFHTGEPSAVESTINVCRNLLQQGVRPVLSDGERSRVLEEASELTELALLGQDVSVAELECAVSIGGDGTFLRTAELVRDGAVPIVGVNLGHVGFLAETEREGIAATVDQILHKKYEIERRLALDVTVFDGNKSVFQTWALNEATVEKALRERLIEVVLEVDNRPLSSFGCDGVVFSTPTGSTAYAFSAGGPVVWPSVDAMLIVPLSAHALFARPLVVGPESTIAVEILERSGGNGVLCCDGRRTFPLEVGARVVISRSDVPVLLARLHDTSFTDRLVTKFDLPVTGWRGPARS